MFYQRVNWENNASTPLSATNLNRMDEGIANIQANAFGTRNVLIDTAIGNDSTGQFDNENLPFKTIEAVASQIENGSTTCIFINGQITLTKANRLVNTTIYICAFGDTVAGNTSKITFGVSSTGTPLFELATSCSLHMMIDADFNQGTEDEVFRCGTGTDLLLGAHGVYRFTNGPLTNGFVFGSSTGLARSGVINVSAGSAPIMREYGAGGGLSLGDVDITGAGADVGSELFSIIGGGVLELRASSFKFQSGVAGSVTDLLSRMTGIKRYANPPSTGIAYNVLSGIDLGTSGGTGIPTQSLYF